jgi:hypothetical protein
VNRGPLSFTEYQDVMGQHFCAVVCKHSKMLVRFMDIQTTLASLSNFYGEPVLLKVLIFSILLNDGCPKRGTDNDVRC